MCEYPEFFDTSEPKARKNHICCECGRLVYPGEKYEKIVGKWDGDISQYKTCTGCASLRDMYTNYLRRYGDDDCGVPIGALYSEMRNSSIDRVQGNSPRDEATKAIRKQWAENLYLQRRANHAQRLIRTGITTQRNWRKKQAIALAKYKLQQQATAGDNHGSSSTQK